MIRRLTSVCLLLGLFVAGCSSDSPNVCITTEDCFAGEVCLSDGTCGEPVTKTDDAGNDDSSSATRDIEFEDPDSRTDAAPDVTDQTDTADPDSGPPDTGPADEDMPPTDAVSCVVDPFDASCDHPDDNDDFSEYFEFSERPGCNRQGDSFVEGSTSFSDVQICAAEERDRYTTNILPCDSQSYVVAVTVTPSPRCLDTEWTLNMDVQGNNCEEPSDKVRCRTLADGSKEVTAVVSPSLSLVSPLIEIEKTNEDVQFDYELEIVVRQ